MAYLVIDKLTKIFKRTKEQDFRAVDELSLSLDEKEMLVLVGPSGCGKTTTLRLIAGLEQPDNGSISIEGRPQTALPPQERNVAMIFQHHALYPHLSARENIAFGLKLRKLPTAEITKRVGEACEMLGLNGCLDRMPADLSGGEQQRLALARALVRRPKVFLLDEPLSQLDAPLRGRMRREIRGLQRRIGAAMIYVTHDQTEAMAMGDRIAVMERGRIQQVDLPRNIYERPANIFTAQFIGSPAMNVLHGRAEAGPGRVVFRCEINGQNGSSISIPLPGHLIEKVRSRSEIAVGFRPEHLRLSSTRLNADAPGPLQAVVELVENTGVDSYVYVSYGTARLVSRYNRGQPPVIGENMTLEFDVEHALFFDSQTGEAIR